MDEAQTGSRRGGWITLPFILGCLAGIALAQSGAQANFIVFLIKRFNIGNIDAAQINNIVSGCTSLSPLAGAILSDAFFGCFPVVAFSTFVSLIGMILLTLSAAVPSLRPTPCATAAGEACDTPSGGQLALLYTAVALLAVGTGGTRFTTATMGANQLDEARERDVFFDWYFIVLYSTSVVAATVIVYVQDSVGWGLGFGLCAAANAVSLAVLLSGARYYRAEKVTGSPFTGIARVVVAAFRKRKVPAADAHVTECYYNLTDQSSKQQSQAVPSTSFGCLNRAALITEGDAIADGTNAMPWRLCTVEQVEDLKSLLRIIPLWTSSIIVSISIGIQASLSVLQALTMDRSLGHRFTVPASSIFVASFAATAITISLLDRAIYPLWQRLRGKPLTPLQRIGAGHALNVVAMIASGLVEKARAAAVAAHYDESHKVGWIVPVPAIWLALPFALVGVAEALHFPGQVALYYQEFPSSLRSTATGMIALIVALGFYLSTAVLDIVRKLTDWLPDNINESRVENVYWMLVGMCAINYGYYLFCAIKYRYQSNLNKLVKEVAA